MVDAFVLVHDVTQLGFVEGVKQRVVQLVCPIVVVLHEIFPDLPQRVDVN